MSPRSRILLLAACLGFTGLALVAYRSAAGHRWDGPTASPCIPGEVETVDGSGEGVCRRLHGLAALDRWEDHLVLTFRQSVPGDSVPWVELYATPRGEERPPCDLATERVLGSWSGDPQGRVWTLTPERPFDVDRGYCLHLTDAAETQQQATVAPEAPGPVLLPLPPIGSHLDPSLGTLPRLSLRSAVVR